MLTSSALTIETGHKACTLHSCPIPLLRDAALPESSPL